MRYLLTAFFVLLAAVAQAEYSRVVSIAASGSMVSYTDPNGFAECERVDIDAMGLTPSAVSRIYFRAITSGSIYSSNSYKYISYGVLQSLSGTSKPIFDTNGERVDGIYDRIMLQDSPVKSGGTVTIAISVFDPSGGGDKRLMWRSMSEEDLDRSTNDAGTARIYNNVPITGFVLGLGSANFSGGRVNVYCVN